MSSLKNALIAIGAAAVTLGATSLIAAHRAPAIVKSAADEPSVERGRYLMATSACGDCHTPFKMGPKGPEPDVSRLYSGHPQGLVMPPAPKLAEGPWVWVGAGTNTAFAGPWGVSYTANLTPDPETGLGKWTEDQFVATLRTGKHLGVSRDVLPPMPIPATREMTDNDLKSIYAYLRTIPAIPNRVPDPTPPG